MRLTSEEINGLITAVSEFISDNYAELRLFGSRVDSQRKGGDIDLLLLVKTIIIKNELNLQKHLLLARMKECIGDQKIDLKIAELNEIESDAFLSFVFPQSVILKIWK